MSFVSDDLFLFLVPFMYNTKPKKQSNKSSFPLFVVLYLKRKLLEIDNS